MEAAAAGATRPGPWIGALTVVGRAVRRDLPFLATALAFVALAKVLSATTGYPRPFSLGVSWYVLAVRMATYAIPAFVLALAWAVLRRGRSLRDRKTWSETLRRFFEPERTSRFLLAFLVLPPFMTAFVAFKVSIPDIHPFSWDAAFMELDRLLHFGRHPWTLLQGLLGSPAATAVVDAIYTSWFPVVWVTFVWQAWHGDYFSGARLQFLVAFATCWIIIGVGAATLLSSAGPVYYGAIVGAPDPFSPLVGQLHMVDEAISLKAVWIQEMLWASYTTPGNDGLVEGISAMPSMHVSIAVLLTLVGFRVSRWVGWAYAAYALLILIGSVHLAWHYAVDGYLAAVLTIVVWRTAGWAIDSWEKLANSGTRMADVR